MPHIVRPRRWLGAPVVAALLALSLTACGGETDDGATAADAGDSAAEAAAEATSDADATESLEEMAQEMADSLEAQQAAEGGAGSATLTAGGETWTFDAALCGFGPEEIGQEGAEFVLSAIQDGLQFYVSIDEFGHSISINDIEDFENPSVALYTDGSAGEFIMLDGKEVSGETTMTDEDGTGDIEASFEATCP